MRVAFRPSDDADIAAMAAIRARASQSEAFWKTRIERYLNGQHSPQHALAARAAFVAVEDGKLVGFVAGHRTQRFDCSGELQWIDVVEERRGNGIANGLLAVMAAWLADQGAFRVCVNVAPQNAAARRLYEKNGAQAMGEHWMLWQDIRALTDVAAP